MSSLVHTPTCSRQAQSTPASRMDVSTSRELKLVKLLQAGIMSVQMEDL